METNTEVLVPRFEAVGMPNQLKQANGTPRIYTVTSGLLLAALQCDHNVDIHRCYVPDADLIKFPTLSKLQETERDKRLIMSIAKLDFHGTPVPSYPISRQRYDIFRYPPKKNGTF